MLDHGLQVVLRGPELGMRERLGDPGSGDLLAGFEPVAGYCVHPDFVRPETGIGLQEGPRQVDALAWPGGHDPAAAATGGCHLGAHPSGVFERGQRPTSSPLIAVTELVGDGGLGCETSVRATELGHVAGDQHGSIGQTGITYEALGQLHAPLDRS